MALIVEDGTGVSDANSYNSITEIRTYADLRGLSLPTEDTEVEVLAIQAMDYLESYRGKYQGSKLSPTQPLQFPRTGVVIDGYEFEPSPLPVLLKQAHAQATAEAYETDLLPNPGQSVKKEKVDVIEVEYAEQLTSAVGFTKVENLIAPLLSGSNPFSVKTVRV